MLGRPDAHLIDGPAGALEVVLESPEGTAPIQMQMPFTR